MKNVKFLLSAACALFAVAAMAQQDFSDPKYAVWGDTPQEREQNILNSNFLKESLDNYRGDGSVTDIMAWFGGYELVMAVGGMLRAAELGMLIIVDGFIMTNCILSLIHI